MPANVSYFTAYHATSFHCTMHNANSLDSCLSCIHCVSKKRAKFETV